VIPWGVEATVFPPCGFDLYDEHTVVVGAELRRIAAQYRALDD
jgi:hypothetical protein